MIKLKKIKGNVKKRLNTLKDQVMDFPEVAFIYLFGSYARNEENDLSDIDLAFYLSESDTNDSLEVKLYERISTHLRTDEITFVSLNNAPLWLAHRVISEGVIIYQTDEKHRLNYIERINKLYLDFLPYHEECGKSVFE